MRYSYVIDSQGHSYIMDTDGTQIRVRQNMGYSYIMGNFGAQIRVRHKHGGVVI